MHSRAPVWPPADARGNHLRLLILAELASRDISRSWLARQVQASGGCTFANTMHYLRGELDCTGHHLGLMLQALGLVITRY